MLPGKASHAIVLCSLLAEALGIRIETVLENTRGVAVVLQSFRFATGGVVTMLKSAGLRRVVVELSDQQLPGWQTRVKVLGIRVLQKDMVETREGDFQHVRQRATS